MAPGRRREDRREPPHRASGLSRARAFARWRALAPAAAILRRSVVERLQWWPLDWRPRSTAAGAPARIAYYHHACPVLSETFIQREVAALRHAGVPVDVIAHETVGAEYFDDDARRLSESAIYVPRAAPPGARNGASAAARHHPFTTANLFLYGTLRLHRPFRRGGNIDLFHRAMVLADVVAANRVTHLHSPFASLDASVALMASRLAGVSFSVQARASDIHRSTNRPEVHERLIHAEFIVTNTRYNEIALRALLPHGAPPIHVIHNGIDLRRFDAPTERSRPGGVPRILSVARLVEPKGLEYLLEACAILRARGRQFRCEIVGGRDEAEVNYALTLRKLMRSLRLEDVVTFAGAQPFDRVLERYRTADVFVFPAVAASDGRRDITPNVLIEAMAMKLPLVSTHSGGIPEIVEDGVSGLLVPTRDAPALAGAIERLLDDRDLQVRLAEAGRRRVEELFDIERNAERYAELFRRCAT